MIHPYLSLDLEILAASVAEAHEQLGAYVTPVARWLCDQPDE